MSKRGSDALRKSSKRKKNPTQVGHYYEILSVADTLMITLNWRKSTENGSTADLEELYHKDKKQYEKALQVLQDSRSYSSFEGNGFYPLATYAPPKFNEVEVCFREVTALNII